MTTVPVDDEVILATVSAGLDEFMADEAARETFVASLIDRDALIGFSTQVAYETLGITPENIVERSDEFRNGVGLCMHSVLVGILFAQRRAELANKGTG